jgi:hypothetical protein
MCLRAVDVDVLRNAIAGDARAEGDLVGVVVVEVGHRSSQPLIDEGRFCSDVGGTCPLDLQVRIGIGEGAAEPFAERRTPRRTPSEAPRSFPRRDGDERGRLLDVYC